VTVDAGAIIIVSTKTPPARSASATLWHPERSDAAIDSWRIRIGHRDGQTGNATHPRQGAHVPLIGLAQSRSAGLVIYNPRVGSFVLPLQFFPRLVTIRCIRATFLLRNDWLSVSIGALLWGLGAAEAASGSCPAG
jgi:hypothetical protein